MYIRCDSSKLRFHRSLANREADWQDVLANVTQITLVVEASENDLKIVLIDNIR